MAILVPASLGHYDEPLRTRLLLMRLDEVGKTMRMMWPDYLGAMRQFDGQLYAFRTTPSGDELRFGPYRGDLGVLEVGPGGRAITELGVIGGLQSRDTFVPLGEPCAGRAQGIPPAVHGARRGLPARVAHHPVWPA